MTDWKQSRRAWYAGGAAGALVVVAIGWFGVIGPELSSTSSTKTQTADAQMQNIALQGKVRALKEQDKKLPTLVRQLAEVQQELPAGSGMSAYITQVMKQADAAGVTLTSVTAGAPTVVTAGTAATSAPVTNPAGHLFSIPVNLVGEGSLAQQRKLLAAIQTAGPRRSLVTSVGYTPVSASGSGTSSVQSIDARTTMSLKLQVFVAPQSPADEAALKEQLSIKTP